MKVKERIDLVLVVMFLSGVSCGLLGGDSLCIFFGIVIAGDIIGTNIYAARPNQSKQ